MTHSHILDSGEPCADTKENEIYLPVFGLDILYQTSLKYIKWFVRRNSIMVGRIRSSHYTPPSSTQSHDSQTHTIQTGLLERQDSNVIPNSCIQKEM
jgi:hypothetical protein